MCFQAAHQHVAHELALARVDNVRQPDAVVARARHLVPIECHAGIAVVGIVRQHGVAIPGHTRVTERLPGHGLHHFAEAIGVFGRGPLNIQSFHEPLFALVNFKAQADRVLGSHVIVDGASVHHHVPKPVGAI